MVKTSLKINNAIGILKMADCRLLMGGWEKVNLMVKLTVFIYSLKYIITTKKLLSQVKL